MLPRVVVTANKACLAEYLSLPSIFLSKPRSFCNLKAAFYYWIWFIRSALYSLGREADERKRKPHTSLQGPVTLCHASQGLWGAGHFMSKELCCLIWIELCEWHSVCWRQAKGLMYNNQCYSHQMMRECFFPQLGPVHVKCTHLCTYFHVLCRACSCAIRRLFYWCLCELPGSVFNSCIKGYSKFVSVDQATWMPAELHINKKKNKNKKEKALQERHAVHRCGANTKCWGCRQHRGGAFGWILPLASSGMHPKPLRDALFVCFRWVKEFYLSVGRDGTQEIKSGVACGSPVSEAGHVDANRSAVPRAKLRFPCLLLLSLWFKEYKLISDKCLRATSIMSLQWPWS